LVVYPCVFPTTVAVSDVIRAVTGQGLTVCNKILQRLIERHPELSAICEQYKFKQSGRGSHKETVVTDARGIVQIMMLLPGQAAAAFRKNAAAVIVRYLRGDPCLVEEIAANRASQEQLAETAPDHPARLFGEAVEQEQTHSDRSLLEAQLEREAAQQLEALLENRHKRLELVRLAWQISLETNVSLPLHFLLVQILVRKSQEHIQRIYRFAVFNKCDIFVHFFFGSHSGDRSL
jgi:hypothetical protein